ncbi:uncharacterized protein LOC141853447 isoform X2 [Brevipalpus obovatus]|uniref:uncharacterized protein LOC141853447 isoform X2 n=1 Tax=Brevipalpus obovatus TaxID=246614 RepID=UPI003D9DBD40
MNNVRRRECTKLSEKFRQDLKAGLIPWVKEDLTYFRVCRRRKEVATKFEDKFNTVIKCIPKCVLIFSDILCESILPYFCPPIEKDCEYPVIVLHQHRPMRWPPHLSLYEGSVALHTVIFNRYSNYKTVVTDWNNPDSPRPDQHDLDYPIRFFLCFANEDVVIKGQDELENLTSSLECPILRGLLTYSMIKPLMYDPVIGELDATPCVSLAIAGENIKVRMLQLPFLNEFHDPINLDKMIEHLRVFKNSLDFVTEDESPHCRTLGFFYVRNLRGTQFVAKTSLCLEFYDEIRKAFPNITFIFITLRNHQMPESDRSDHDVILYLLNFS